MKLCNLKIMNRLGEIGFQVEVKIEDIVTFCNYILSNITYIIKFI